MLYPLKYELEGQIHGLDAFPQMVCSQIRDSAIAKLAPSCIPHDALCSWEDAGYTHTKQCQLSEARHCTISLYQLLRF